MRYFKYIPADDNENAGLKEQYANITAAEKKALRKAKILSRLATVVFFTVMIACFIGCGLLIALIPEPEFVIETILYVLLKVLLWPVSLINSILLGFAASMPFRNRSDSRYKVIKQAILAKACEHLREYYGLQEPCLVTKCYDSSDKRFVDHDVCLFVVDDELRITANLKYGFVRADKDLGCYAFKVEELSLSPIKTDRYLATDLKADGVEFQLCYRAGRFIERNFESYKNI